MGWRGPCRTTGDARIGSGSAAMPSCATLRATARTVGPSSFSGTKVEVRVRGAKPCARALVLDVGARFKARGADLGKVELVQRGESDTGSTEVQIARLTARIVHLTDHLKEHKKDYATQRGLQMILGKRKRLMNYLLREDKEKYVQVMQTLGIRSKIAN